MYRRYKEFPTYKALYGLVFDYGESHKEDRYEWMPDTAQYHDPILRSGLSGVKRVYVGFLQKWLKPDVFIKYLKSKDYQLDKDKIIKGNKKK